MNKFEKLIELVTEGEEAKAEELFHEIVVEKSRDIYESLMNDEDEMGGDKADHLINDITADEEGMRENEDEGGEEGEMLDMEPEGDMDDMDDMGDMGPEEGEEDLEDRVVDLEDQLDALMAEFDAVMGDEMGDEEGEADVDLDVDMDAEEEGEDEMMAGAYESEENDENALEENVELKKVSKGVAGTSEGESVGSGSESTNINKKSTVAANSGAKGAAAKPHQTTGEESGRPDPDAEDMGYDNQDSGQKAYKQQAPKAKMSGEDGSVNKKSISGS